MITEEKVWVVDWKSSTYWEETPKNLYEKEGITIDVEVKTISFLDEYFHQEYGIVSEIIDGKPGELLPSPCNSLVIFFDFSEFQKYIVTAINYGYSDFVVE